VAKLAVFENLVDEGYFKILIIKIKYWYGEGSFWPSLMLMQKNPYEICTGLYAIIVSHRP
jgi:hypothetical protein